MDLLMLRALDLFSGIAGNTLGLREYIKTIAYCEFDRHAQSVLLSRMSDGSIDSAPICTDVTQLDGSELKGQVDIIIGGFPCQDISVAGLGAGLEGKRSGLFYEIIRLAKEIQPTFLFLENVAAIRTRGLDTVIQELTQIGYDCRWTMLSASDVGAPHKRERWFLLGYSKYNGQLTSEKSRSDGKNYREESTGENESSQFERTGSCGDVCRNISKCSNDMANTYSEYDKSFKRGLECTSGQTREQIWGNGSISSSSIGSGRREKIKSRLGESLDGVSKRLDSAKQNWPKLVNCWQEGWEDETPRTTQEKDLRSERLKRLGNAVVPLQAKTAFEILMGIKYK